MNKIQCEVCGSNDFIKQNEYFICQHCGCKYTVEQAKKMMIEGVVSVEGSVSINTSEKIKNLYTIARRSRDNNDWDAAKRYYDLVLQEDPLSWEAIFFLAYFDAVYCKNGELKYKAIKMANCITSVCDLINQSSMSTKEKFDAYIMLSKYVIIISDGLQERAKNFRNSMVGIKFISPTSLITAGKDQETYEETVIPMINCYYFFADGIEKIIDQFEEYPDIKEIMVLAWGAANNSLYQLYGRRMGEQNKKIIENYKAKIAKYGEGLNVDKTNTVDEGSAEENLDVPSATPGIVLGALSLGTGIFILAIIGLVLSIKASRGGNRKAKVGKILSIIGLVIGLYLLLGILIYFNS